MKVLCCGDRNWTNVERVLEVLKRLPQNSVIVHGACKGADTICGVVAQELGMVIRSYPADWSRYKKRAGPFRNRQMLLEEHTAGEPINFVIAFHDNINESKGTADMLRIATKSNIKTLLITTSEQTLNVAV